MARTVGQVVSAARAIIQDTRPTFRITDADLAGYVSEAIAEARRMRPDLFASTFRNPMPYYTPANFNTVLPIPDFYFTHIVNYVVGRADLREDEFAQDGRAITLLTAFGVALTGGGR